MSESISLNVAKALQETRALLEDCSPTPDLDAQLLVGFVLGLSRLELIVESKREFSQDEIFLLTTVIQRRRAQEPVAYIIGKKEFWGLDFEVNKDVLVPRPDTELLVDIALTYSAEFPDPILVCDLGTGSGCISIALAFELKRRSRNFFILACDKSRDALKIAKRNAINNNLEKEVNFVCSDWSSALKQDFDLVLSNPPYLMDKDPEVSPELQFEPQTALYSGEDGLNDYKKIFGSLPSLLSAKGVFLGEIGYGQAQPIEALAKKLLPDPYIEFHYDLRRVQRVVEIRLPER